MGGLGGYRKKNRKSYPTNPYLEQLAGTPLPCESFATRKAYVWMEKDGLLDEMEKDGLPDEM